jgi:hypothetical protein
MEGREAGANMVVLCFVQWYYTWRILDGEFSDQETLDAYEKEEPEENQWLAFPFCI